MDPVLKIRDLCMYNQKRKTQNPRVSKVLGYGGEGGI